jgi:ankyrin repeat protein
MGDLEICRVLLSFGADVNHQNAVGDTALIMASRYDHLSVVKCLLENGAEIDIRNKKWSTALLVAARHDAIDVLEILLRYGAHPRVKDKKGRTPLHRAVEGIWLVDGVPGTVKEDMVRKLLRAGANPDAKDLEGKTAAQRAGWLRGSEGLRKLLEGRSRSIERLQPDQLNSRSKTF